MTRFLFLVLCLLLGCFKIAAQPQPMDVIINEIHNQTNQNLEWTEILVVKDNISLAGFYFGDNNGVTNSWQPKIRFTNNVLWQRLRAGTYIIINHANSTANCGEQRQDFDKSDGFIRVCSKNTTYFSGGTGNSLALNSDGDFLHLVDPNGRHVHGLGFDNQPNGSVEGGNCVEISQSWLNTTSAVANLRPCNFFNFYRFRLGNTLSVGNLTGNFPADFNARMQSDTLNGKVGILVSPTPGQGNTFQNQQLIASWREPQIDSQTVCARTSALGTSFSWRMAADQYPTDSTTGYLILKSVGSELFPDPLDGRIYNLGDTLRAGGVKAAVIAIKNNSLDTTHFDPANTGIGIPVYYRVYAFRYSNSPGVTSFDRGRAYNTSRYVKVSPGNLAPPTVSRITDVCSSGPVTLRALPNVTGALYQWRRGSVNAIPVPGVNGFEYSFPAPATTDSVFVSYQSSGGCQTSFTRFIISPAPVFVARTLTAPSLICPGDTFTISVNGINTASYAWEIPPVFQILSPITANTTSLRLVAQSAVSDSTRFAVTEIVGVCSGARLTSGFVLRQRPQISITGDTLIQYGSGTTLTIQTDGLASWLNANGGLVANSNTLLLNALGETTTYRARSEIVNSTGCVTTKLQTITVLARPDIKIPNVITSGTKDGKNDVFVVKGGLFRNFTVFNRWGKKVFEAETYQNDWATDEPGTYYYEAMLDDGFRPVQKQGTIQVLK